MIVLNIVMTFMLYKIYKIKKIDPILYNVDEQIYFLEKKIELQEEYIDSLLKQRGQFAEYFFRKGWNCFHVRDGEIYVSKKDSEHRINIKDLIETKER